jgi:hypothetical protein
VIYSGCYIPPFPFDIVVSETDVGKIGVWFSNPITSSRLDLPFGWVSLMSSDLSPRHSTNAWLIERNRFSYKSGPNVKSTPNASATPNFADPATACTKPSLTMALLRRTSGFLFPQGHATCIVSTLKQAEDDCAARSLKFTSVRRRSLEILFREHRATGAYDLLAVLAKDGHSAQPPIAYPALDFFVSAGFAPQNRTD